MATTQHLINVEDAKFRGIDPDTLSVDARAIVKAISALTGTVAALALAVDGLRGDLDGIRSVIGGR